MNDRLPVLTDLPAYRVAVAALPLRTQRASEAAGAIVVVDGATSWWEGAAVAVAAGASAVLIDEPRNIPLTALSDLLARCPVPVIVHRSRLRHDLVSQAVEQRGGILPRVIVAECRASPAGLAAMVRDAAGWMRELSNTSLTVSATTLGPDGGTALLRGAASDRVVGSMTITVTRPEGTLLRITGLGEVTTDLEIDEPLGRSELATSTGSGRMVAPSRFEAGERVALRRALNAVMGNTLPLDLTGLSHDAEVADAILSAGTSPALVAL